MQEPISRDVAASLVGGELLSALSRFGSPSARKGRLVSPIPVVSGPLSGAVSRFGK